MTIQSSNYQDVYRAFTKAFKRELLSLRRDERVLQARVSLIADISLKPLKERLDWAKTVSSGGKNFTRESFIKTYSLNQELSELPSSRSAPLAQLSSGNQWLELHSPHTQKTPLSVFLRKVGLLDSNGTLCFDRPSLNRNIALSKSLDLLAEMLEQEKKTCSLEEFIFNYDDLGELDLQMQAFAYQKLAWLLTKFVKKEPLADALKEIIASEKSQEVKILDCKKTLEDLPNHLFFKILNCLFANEVQIETKAKELIFKGSHWVKPADLEWNPGVCIADQWVQLTSFEEEASQVVYLKYQKKLEDLGVHSLVEVSTSDLNELVGDCQAFLRSRIDSLIRSSVLSLSAPSDTVYGRFSQFHKDLTLKYEHIISSEPTYRSFADLAYANYSATALHSLNHKRTVSEKELALANEAAVATFVSIHLGKSEAIYPNLLKIWNMKIAGLQDDKTSPFYLFLKSRGFFSEKNQEISLSLKVSRFLSYQALFSVLMNIEARKLGVSIGELSNDTSFTSDQARCVAFACFQQAIPYVTPALEKRVLNQFYKLNGSLKEKIVQAETLLAEIEHPDKEALLLILTGFFIGNKSKKSIIEVTFSIEEISSNPIIQEFISAMEIEDRKGASYDENYFEKAEAIMKFKNYLIEHVTEDPHFTQKLKQLKGFDLRGFSALLLNQTKAKKWIKDMHKQINQDVSWLKKKAEIYELPRLMQLLSKASTGYEKIIAVSKGFQLLQGKLKKEIVDKGLLSVFERFVEESCLAENTAALDHVIQKMEIAL